MDIKWNTFAKKIIIACVITALGLAAYVYWGRNLTGPGDLKELAVKTPEAPMHAITVIPESKATDAGRMPAADVCRGNREKLQGLFAYLDRQEYIASRRIAGGSIEHFRYLVTRVLAKPPHVQRETDDILQVLQNMAHFYRVLGKKDTLLLREVLRKDGDMMESAFAIIYQAMALQEKCKAEGPDFAVTLKKVYPYSVFFLNTLGGSAYLMRRESRVRMLTRYYSILVLDQANQRRLNYLGLDIRPSLDILLGDLKGSKNLSRSAEYISSLTAIRARY